MSAAARWASAPLTLLTGLTGRIPQAWTRQPTGLTTCGLLLVDLLALAWLGGIPGAEGVHLLLGLCVVADFVMRVTPRLPGQPVAVALPGLDVRGEVTTAGGCTGCGDRLPDVVVTRAGQVEDGYCGQCAASEDLRVLPMRPATRGDRLFRAAWRAGVLPPSVRSRCSSRGGWHFSGAAIGACRACRRARARDPWWIAADGLGLPSPQARERAYRTVIVAQPVLSPVTAVSGG